MEGVERTGKHKVSNYFPERGASSLNLTAQSLVSLSHYGQLVVKQRNKTKCDGREQNTKKTLGNKKKKREKLIGDRKWNRGE